MRRGALQPGQRRLFDRTFLLGAHAQNLRDLARAEGAREPEAGAEYQRLLLLRRKRRKTSAEPRYERGQRALGQRLLPGLGLPRRSAVSTIVRVPG